MKKIERKEARIQGLKRYYTGKPCKRGHVDERYVANGRCLSCMDKWKEDNRDKVVSMKAAWNERNKDYHANYYSENKDKKIERSKVNSRLHNKKYPWKALARTRAYQAAKEKRAISLSDSHKSDILHIYQQSALLRHLGYDYQVDHVVPLRGKTVSGLHVPWNLQVIPASQNMSKGNKISHEYIAD